jgi:predicted small secreted protein
MCGASPERCRRIPRYLLLEMTFMKRLAVTVMLMLSVLGLSACNTIHGMGQDIEKAGEAISNAAKK